MLLLILGIVLTAVSWYFAWSHIGPVSEYSFFPLWVGYILLVNGLSEVMAGTSLLRRMRWSFLWLFVISIPMWWFFEYMNTIVQNWHYVFNDPEQFYGVALHELAHYAERRVMPSEWLARRRLLRNTGGSFGIIRQRQLAGPRGVMRAVCSTKRSKAERELLGRSW